VRETRADNTQALLYSLALHVLIFAIAFIGLWWTRSTALLSAAGPVIEAELIDPNALSASMRRALQRRPEPVQPQPDPVPRPEPVEEEAAPVLQPEREPAPQDAPVPPQQQAQERVPEPDTREQERVSRAAMAQETREREQDEKRRQEQIDLTERERQQEAERRQRLSQMELERQQQLADIKRRRALAARDAKVAEARLKQLAEYQARNAAEAAAQADAESSASPPPGNEGRDTGLEARYAAALREAILRNWTRPDSVPLGQRCRINIRQLPGGEVVDVEVSASCPYDELGRRSVEAAVLKAQPLPYAGFEAVFRRNLNLNFEAQEP
jgi:colicin import membrane protein